MLVRVRIWILSLRLWLRLQRLLERGRLWRSLSRLQVGSRKLQPLSPLRLSLACRLLLRRLICGISIGPSCILWCTSHHGSVG